MTYATLKSIASYVPSNTLTNKDLEKIVDTSDEWIEQRTGIKSRQIADKNETTSDMGAKAGKIAIQRAGLKTEDIDLIICATISPDYFCMPATACVIADKLGIYNTPAYDISAACSGFVYAMQQAKAFIESGTYKNILIIGAEKLSSITNYNDRSTCILFGDGAGASVISGCQDEDLSIKDIHISSDGKYQELLITPGGGSKHPTSEEVIEKEMAFMQMSGNEVFKVAVKTLTKDVVDILENNKIEANKIDWFIPHQANYRIIEAVRKKLDFPHEKTVLTVAKYGNTSAASIPMAMNDAFEEGKLKKGDLMLLDTFGGGFTWGSALVHFNG